jgi:2-alkenal reductase
MDLTVDKGAYLAEVVSQGPSDKAGLRGANREAVVDGRALEIGGDVITAIDGQPVNTFDDLLIYIALNSAPGQTVTLSVLRDGETREIQVTLEERPETLE